MAHSADNETFLDGETLFRRYAQFVAAFLYRLGTPPSDVNDLVQEVFMIAHKRGGYRPGATSPKTFLARISLEAKLANQRKNHRWSKSHGIDLASETVGDTPETPEQALALERAARKLQRALDTMEPEARTVFILFELNGETCESIADGLDLKIGTVYSRLHYARKRFFAAVRGTDSQKVSQITPVAKRGAL